MICKSHKPLMHSQQSKVIIANAEMKKLLKDHFEFKGSRP